MLHTKSLKHGSDSGFDGNSRCWISELKPRAPLKTGTHNKTDRNSLAVAASAETVSQGKPTLRNGCHLGQGTNPLKLCGGLTYEATELAILKEGERQRECKTPDTLVEGLSRNP
jgi:hypothetical protein